MLIETYTEDELLRGIAGEVVAGDFEFCLEEDESQVVYYQDMSSCVLGKTLNVRRGHGNTKSYPFVEISTGYHIPRFIVKKEN